MPAALGLLAAACHEPNPSYVGPRADAGQGDASASLPAVAPDAAPGHVAVRSCAPAVPPLPGTVALYDFEDLVPGASPRPGALVRDRQGAHPATVHGAALGSVEGPSGCGRALLFPEQDDPGSFLVIPDSPAWQLTEGSVDFWLRPTSCGGTEQPSGVVSRDALGQTHPGHFRIVLRHDCRLEVRLQRDLESGDPAPAPPVVPRNTWSHVGVSFGPDGVTLYLNGALVLRQARAGGIAGNRNPWAIGADTAFSAEGSVAPTTGILRGAALDHVRISKVQRDFSR